MVSCGRHQRPDQPERFNVAGIGCYITKQNYAVRARYQPAAKDKSKEIAPTPSTNGAANWECEIFERFLHLGHLHEQTFQHFERNLEGECR